MSTWATPLADLRVFLRDTTNDWIVKEQKVLGRVDGQNRTYYTFFDRIVASGNQSACGVPLRLFYDGVEITASGIAVSDQIRGEFAVMQVASGVEVTATYHHQQFLDGELNQYLQQAANMVSADVAADIPAQLQLAAMHIAASQAYTGAAIRWQQRKSEQFMLQDIPSATQAEQKADWYQKAAAEMMTQGLALRQQFYNLRLDRGRAPAFGLLQRTPSPYTPRR